MNVFYMNSVRQTTWGGVEKWMLLSAGGLQSGGHRIFAGARPDSIFIKRCAAAGFETFPLKIGIDFGPVNVARMAAIFRKYKIDAIVANLNKDVRMAGIAAWLAGNPPLVARAGLAILPDNAKYRLTYKHLADGIVTNTAAIKNKYLEYSWLQDDFIKVIYNGIDTSISVDYSPADVRRKFDLPIGKKLISLFGRMVPQKQHHLFLQVAKNILGSHPDTHFLIVGDGPLKNEISSKVADLGISENVHIIGFQENIIPLQVASDIVLLTSSDEGMPNVVMEAMLSAKPIVAFNVGGVRELLPDDRYGKVVGADDVSAMTRETIALLEDEATCNTLGEQAQVRIRTNFSLEKMVNDFEAYLKLLIKQKAGKR